MIAMKCIFGCDDAIGWFWLPRGCFCYPDDQLPLLCAQHLYKSTDLDGIYRFIYWGA